MTPTRVRKRSVGVPGTAQGKTSTTEGFTPTHQQKEQFAGGQWGVRRWVYEHIWRASLVNPYHSLKHSRSVSFKNNTTTTTTTTDPFIPCYSPATPLFAVLNLVKNCSYLLSIFCPPLIPQCSLTLLPPWIPCQNHVHQNHQWLILAIPINVFHFFIFTGFSRALSIVLTYFFLVSHYTLLIEICFVSLAVPFSPLSLLLPLKVSFPGIVLGAVREYRKRNMFCLSVPNLGLWKWKYYRRKKKELHIRD